MRQARKPMTWATKSKVQENKQMMPVVSLKLSVLFVKLLPLRLPLLLQPCQPQPLLQEKPLWIWRPKVPPMPMVSLQPLLKRVSQPTSSKSICMPPSLLTYLPKHSQNRWLRTSNRWLPLPMLLAKPRWIWKNSQKQRQRRKRHSLTLKRHKLPTMKP